MARFKTVLENAIALRRSGRALRWQEVALVKAVLGDGSGQGFGQSPASGQGPKQAASKPVYAWGLKFASGAVQRRQATLREHALKHGQRRGEWRGWSATLAGATFKKKGCNERRKAA